MRFTAVIMMVLLASGCSSKKISVPETEPEAKRVPSSGVRLCILTPDRQIHTLADGKYARWADQRHRSGDGSTPFRGAILSDSQISEIEEIITRGHVVPWQSMAAETPYPSDHAAVLLYRIEGEGLMCSLGNAPRAHNVLRELVNSVPKEHRARLQKSITRMKSTQPEN